MRQVKRRHPPGDAKAAHQYDMYLEANDPRRQSPDSDGFGLGPEPDFPGDVRDV